MNILGLPNEIIHNIVYYLDMRDTRNLKLSNYELNEKIGSYQLDLQQIIRSLIRIDIYWNVYDMLYRNCSKVICNYRMWFDNNFELATEPNTICIEVSGLEQNRIRMEDELIKLDYKFYGCLDIVAEDMLYGISLGDDNDMDKLEKLFTNRLIEFYDRMDIYQYETIHLVMKHLIYRKQGGNIKANKLYEDLDNVRNYNNLSELEYYKLCDYIIRKQVRYRN